MLPHSAVLFAKKLVFFASSRIVYATLRSIIHDVVVSSGILTSHAVNIVLLINTGRTLFIGECQQSCQCVDFMLMSS